MKGIWMAALVVFLAAVPALAQQAIDPQELKISPLKYKNSYIKINDVYIHFRAGGPVRLDEAGYPLDRNIPSGRPRPVCAVS